MTDPNYYTGSDDRDGLTQRAPEAPATTAPICRHCGFVVYAVGVPLPYGGVLCRRCAEQAEHDLPGGDDFRGGEAAGYLAEQQRAAMRLKR